MTIRRQRKVQWRKYNRKKWHKLSLIAICLQNRTMMQLYKAIRGLE